jgi:AcrR family transcriptional regulator
MDDVSARRALIMEHASALFQRLGYAKTTLVDVARSAGISRPTLYAEFTDKDALYDAVLDAMATDLIIEIGNELRGRRTPRAKLLHACTRWVEVGYTWVQANPEAADLFDPGFPPVRRANARFEHFLEGLLAEDVATSSRTLSAARLAEVMSLSLQGFRSFAPTRERLVALTETLVDAVCGALRSDG